MDVINSLLRAARAGNLKRVIEFIEDDLVDINAGNQNGLTALHSASKEGHTRIVEELISRGANVHAKTLKGNTALHIASLAGHEPVVRVLIENGADVDAQSGSGFTALYMAAQENHETIVKLLLANMANQNIATTDGFTPLAVAMQQGHEQIASILLNNEAKGRIRFPGTTESGRSLLHIAAKKDDCAAAALLMQNNISPDLTSKSGFTALHVASRYGNENVAKLLIDRQANVNFQAKHNITPLHVAAKWGQTNLVDLLLANNARIDATTRDGLTPLHCAARSGHDTVVEDLIKRAAPISAKTRSGLAPLHMATQGDHHRSAQILLNNGAPVDDVTVDYLTALHVASHCGHVKVAKLLLNNKADPNFRALNGFTSLHIACKKNRIEVVKLLLKYGASLNAVTESGLTPLHVASFMGCVQIVIYLLDNHANIESVTVRGETPLHLATRANQIDVINVLLRYGANVSARAKESQTALHIASRLGNADIAKLLIQQGIDVDAPTKDSYTALHIAAKEGHEDVVSILLNQGANISCATRNHGFTPLHLASKYGIDGVVDLLLSYGAPVDAQGKNGVTPLHVATHYDHLSVVQLLLNPPHQAKGASPHAMAKNGYTALHIAAKGNRLDIASALLQHNANPNAESKAGFCPLHLAAQEGRTDMAALLLNNGAIVNCRAKNGITPLHLCAQEDHVNVAQLLVKRGAYLDEQTKGGFTPLHVASHFARIKMIRFLLANGANVNIPAASGYTPLHQASQQGNPQIVELLLQYNAKPDALTEGGQTALSIAQNLGYVSIIDTLKVVTETVVKTTTMTITEEKFKIIAPETMQETFVSDSEDEADDTAHAESVKFLTTDVMKNFNTMADDYHTSQSNLMAATDAGQQKTTTSNRQPQVVDEMSQDLTYLSRDAPLDGGESTFGAATSYSQLGGSQREESVLHMGSDLDYDDQDQIIGRRQLTESPTRGFAHNEQALNQLSPDNVDIQKPLQQAGPIDEPQSGESTLPLKPFLVSFMVDARGGAMRGCRHSGVRVIIPPNSAQMPMRITCRYLRRERLVHPPPLMEGEACASKIMEVGPAGAKFLGPVLIEVPHFASLRGKEREIIILRSDTGEIWREHLVEPDDRLIDSIIRSAQLQPDEDQENTAKSSGDGGDQQTGGDNNKSSRRLTRIVTNEFPQYFAIISRIRQEVHAVGPDGTTVNSQVVPRVQAIFTEGALTKRIKIGLQPKGNKKDAQQQQDTTALQSTNLSSQQQQGNTCLDASFEQQRSGSPTAAQPDSLTSTGGDRAVSPQSNQGSQAAAGGRPGSAAAKRRSRFLACFGGGQGSVDLLNSADESSGASAGGDSPRQPCNEKLCERRHILGDINDSDGETRSLTPSSLSGGGGRSSPKVRTRRHIEALELVPDDYYIEKEPPLILNVEPKTYGKRLASSSCQTDNKLNVNGYMSISTKKSSKKSRGGLLRGGKRKNKTQLTIHCDPVHQQQQQSVPKSNNGEQLADSSLESERDANLANIAKLNGAAADDISIIQDVITSDDHKWRTCTIQTDSDSVTVNYVTSTDANNSAAAATANGAPTSGQDDGYVSGSGDINKHTQTQSKGGLFGLSSAFGGADKHQQAQLAAVEQTTEAKRSKLGKKWKKGRKAEAATSTEPQVVAAAGSSPTASPEPADLSSVFDKQSSGDGEQMVVETITITGTGNDDSLATTTTRSISPTSKELKQKLKLERQEKLRREKEEKRLLKELEDAAAKAEKLKKKLDKEAKKAEKLAQKALAKSGGKSPPTSVPPTPQPDGGEQVPAAGATSSRTSVKFANTLVETSNSMSGSEPSSFHQQLDSIQRVIETTNESYEKEKERLSQEDGRDMIRVSISEKITVSSASASLANQQLQQPEQPPQQLSGGSGEPAAPADIKSTDDTVVVTSSQPFTSGDSDQLKRLAPEEADEKLISFTSDSIITSDPSKSLEMNATAADEQLQRQQAQPPILTTTNLKPILKQQSTVSSQDESAAELVISEERRLASNASRLASEASAEAVRVADELKAAAAAAAEPTLSKKELAKQAKEEKDRLKREAKEEAEEEKRQVKEVKRLAKEAQEAKKAEEAEAKRAGKQAKAELERQMKEAKAEQARLAKEAKKRLKLEEKEKKQQQVSAAGEPSAPPAAGEPATVTEPTEPTDVKEQLPADTSEPKIEVEVSTTEIVVSDEPKNKKKEKKEKPKKAKRSAAPEAEEPLGTKTKSSWFSRLFNKQYPKSIDDEGKKNETIVVETIIEQQKQTKGGDKPLIMSEMYPSDPDDADGEMILEVNVPKNLIDNQLAGQQQVQQSGSRPLIDEDDNTSPTLAAMSTTIDETLRSTAHHEQPARKSLTSDMSTTTIGDGQQQPVDDQATLVNVSQMITSEIDDNDDDATENVVSQASHLGHDQVTTPLQQYPAVIETVVVTDQQEVGGVTEKTKEEAHLDDKRKKVEEKKRKELEAKLEKEAKKRKKEEEKLKKRQEKEEELKVKMEKKMAEIEAKKCAKEEKERAKREAKEAKKLAKLAKKKIEVDPSASSSSTTRVVSGSQVFQESGAPGASVDQQKAPEFEQVDPEIDTSNMTPVKTETEVERIVEEVVGEDGVVTKTTKTIETKYVTMRQEERMSEVREVPIEEYERMRKRGSLSSSSSSSFASSRLIVEQQQVAPVATETATKKRFARQIVVAPYEHAELDEIRAIPSYFSADNAHVAELEQAGGELSPKKAMKKRIKLNQKLIKRAYKLAKSEAKKAKKNRRQAESEIAVCDEAAKQARKELKRALRETKRAAKSAAKEHKKMDKVDKKLAKRQKKIEKRQRKLDKRAIKLAKKEAKKREKLAAKEAKEAKSLERKSSQRSQSQASGSRKSIKLEDIGEPVLRSSSRLSIGGGQQSVEQSIGDNNQMVSGETGGKTVIIGRNSPASDGDIQVEMSLDYSQVRQERLDSLQDNEQVAATVARLSSEMQPGDVEVIHSITTRTITEGPDGQVSEQVSQRVLTGDEAREAAQLMAKRTGSGGESDEEIDVVNDLPAKFVKDRKDDSD